MKPFWNLLAAFAAIFALVRIDQRLPSFNLILLAVVCGWMGRKK